MSSKRTVNLLEDDRITYTNGSIYRGEFIPGLHCRAFTVNAPSSGIFVSSKYSFLFDKYFLTDQAYLMDSTDGKTFKLNAALDGENPGFLEFYNSKGAPCILAYSSKKAVLYDGSKTTKLIMRYSMRGAIMHCGRVFFIPVSDEISVGWSAPLDIENPDESLDAGGWVKLNPEGGKVLQLLEYGDKIAVVREYGINLLSMMGSPENYRAEITNTVCEKIYQNSAVAADGKICFLSVSGVCTFDGSVIKRLPFKYADKMISVKDAAMYKGKYIIYGEARLNSDGVVFCYDPEDYSCYLMYIKSPKSGSLCLGKDFRIYNDGACYCIEDAPYYELVTDEAINFGSFKDKTLTEIYIDGVADVIIGNGKVTRTFTGATGIIRPNMRGKSFFYKLTVDRSKCNAVRAFTATLEECDAI